MRAMRRWLLIALLFVLPLQFSWAAAAAYCGHEPAPARTHTGHHAHAHAASVADASQAQSDGVAKAQASPSGVDHDCGFCHLGCAQPLPSQAPSLPLGARDTIAAPATPSFASRGPDHPDRPDWRLA